MNSKLIVQIDDDEDDHEIELRLMQHTQLRRIVLVVIPYVTYFMTYLNSGYIAMGRPSEPIIAALTR